MPKGIFKRSEEHKRNLSIAHKGLQAGKKNPMFGRTHTPEARASISKFTRERVTGSGNPMFGKKHTPETIEKISKIITGLNRKGEKSASWKGGITTEYMSERTSIEARIWREAVFARDNWTCQKYGVRNEHLNAHHIKNFSKYKELRFAIDNGITFSVRAHKEFHLKYGTKDNTIEQIEEFIGRKVI